MDDVEFRWRELEPFLSLLERERRGAPLVLCSETGLSLGPLFPGIPEGPCTDPFGVDMSECDIDNIEAISDPLPRFTPPRVAENSLYPQKTNNQPKRSQRKFAPLISEMNGHGERNMKG